MSEKQQNTKKIMSRKSQMRLLRDVKDLYKNSLSEHGIYYIHDEADMQKGYAVVFGPSDTLYQYGAYFFEFNFPYNYPFSPPKLKYLTNDGITRFNPNLYRNGKVCISILNTWKGEQWTSCQTIRTVLLTLVTLFHNKPLLNEPGIKESYKDFNAYNQIIKFKNYEIAIYRILAKKLMPDKFITFYPIIKKNFIKYKEKIIEDINNMKSSEFNEKNIRCSIYNMNAHIDYGKLNNDITNIINSF